IIWLGAASGSMLMIANVIRIAARYNNLDCLEDGYGINLRPLSNFANRVYKKDPCTPFFPKKENSDTSEGDKFVARLHKAIAIIQFKLEDAIIRRHPEFGLDERRMLHKIDYEKGTISLYGETYSLLNPEFPTVDPEDPYALTEEEAHVMRHLTQLFLHNEMLQKHVRFLFRKGSMIKRANNTLLFHAGFPLNEDGSFMTQTFDGKEASGKALFDLYEQKIRNAYLNRYDKENPERDYFMMLWQGPTSPLFAKDRMRTFERYFLKEKHLHKETMNPYFNKREDKTVLKRILKEYNIDFEKGRIVNGHVPLDVTRGHDVVLADKHIYLIDGGMSKEYASHTNIGGYTLISDSYAFYLVSHSRFNSYEDLIREEKDIVSVLHSEDLNTRRTYIYDTDNGKALKQKIEDLATLIDLYRDGVLRETEKKPNGA
ncbi:MAG: fructose-bisphosphatase class III, partial [Bacillota bacterium]